MKRHRVSIMENISCCDRQINENEKEKQFFLLNRCRTLVIFYLYLMSHSSSLSFCINKNIYKNADKNLN